MTDPSAVIWAGTRKIRRKAIRVVEPVLFLGAPGGDLGLNLVKTRG